MKNAKIDFADVKFAMLVTISAKIDYWQGRWPGLLKFITSELPMYYKTYRNTIGFNFLEGGSGRVSFLEPSPMEFKIRMKWNKIYFCTLSNRKLK